MTHATTALLLTAPIVVPLATSAAYAASGLRDAKARAGAAALAHRTPRQRGAAAPVATLVLRPGRGPATYGTAPATAPDGPPYRGRTATGSGAGGGVAGSAGLAATGPSAPARSQGGNDCLPAGPGRYGGAPGEQAVPRGPGAPGLRPGGPARPGTRPGTADGPGDGGPARPAGPGTEPGGSARFGSEPAGPPHPGATPAGPDGAAPGRGAGAGPERPARPGRGPGAPPRTWASLRAARSGPVPRPLTGRLGLVSPFAILTCGAALACTVPDSGPVTAYGRLLRADALTVWMLLTVGAVACLACAANPAHLAHERTDEPAARRYLLLVHAFLAAMSAAVLAANLGVLWVAIEATTIVTAFLVGHRRTRASVEAAWKYVVICSAGIALAFLGTVLLYYAARQAGIPEADALDWQALRAHAGRLDPSVTRLATGLVVLGFGAKAGLAPLHAWLPDAHSQAPAPVSALMSGVLLSVAFAGLLRYKVIADTALGTGFTRTLLAGVAVLTLALATALLLAQRDYKRMLAYSSMEHMSLIALGTAVGSPLALSAVLLHVAGHGLAKTVAFCASGHIARLCGTTRIGRIRGLLAHSPCLGTAFGAAVVALLGLPPFGLFASELGIARAGFLSGPRWALAAALVLMLAAFAALAARTARMLLGPPPGEDDEEEPVPLGADAAAPLVAGLAACAALGVTTGPLTALLSEAGEIIGGR
ncbi:proton-conducting transporter membrane subunit [Streptomyces sp. VNUA116]|uniref:proton-conducting transporter transmembrane domain-containing protein n=1 Tax=Streptomyces sp. VNUA116 TaxID=3062449 RepID=UPI0026771C2A|nr:proton-conducting transporter membrane subunit [Streptomyces sp. VNUA116]WKU48461.1 proton-conducting transporter membrane subunit [Streptomyces sp. VNUA116]